MHKKGGAGAVKRGIMGDVRTWFMSDARQASTIAALSRDSLPAARNVAAQP